MSRMHVVHTTRFRYGGAVTASYNEARMTPLSGRGQTVLASSLQVDPSTWRHEYRDYWGTAVTAFEATVPHESLVLFASSRVEVSAVTWPTAPVGWDVLGSGAARNEYAEFLVDSAATRVPDELGAIAAEAASGRSPHEAAQLVCGAVYDGVEYVPGSTGVHTFAAEAWDARKGVCQDMAQLAVGAMRSVGIPARYVSGYLHPRSDAEIGEAVEGQSHAWVEWWVGQWVPFDPTNSIPVADNHVVLGRAREYRDVAPLRGIYAGAVTEELEVSVRVTREA